MWLSLAFAGSLEVLGDPAFRAPDGIVDAAVAPDGAAWVISEHGAVVGFEPDGKVGSTFEACPARGPHTELWSDETGRHLGVICEDRFRVLALPDGQEVLEVPFQVRSASLTDDELVLVGEPFQDGETGTTRLVRYALATGRPTGEYEGDFAAAAHVDRELVALIRNEPDENEPTEEWGLVRVTADGLEPTFSFPGAEPPLLSVRSPSTVCVSRAGTGRCFDLATRAKVPLRDQDLPFVAPEQGIPVCGGGVCFDVDRTRLRPAGTEPGIGRIEDLVASDDGKHLLTRDHRDQVLHHGPRGRRPIATTDGALAISPSGRYAWYQTARRSIRVRLIDGVRTTLPRATAAVFDVHDDLWLAMPHQANTTLLSKLPTGLDTPLPIIPLHDGRTITQLQLGGNRLLLSYAQDDLYAVVDLDLRAPIDPSGKPTRKPHQEHLFTEQTPLLLTDVGTLVRAVETDAGFEVRGSLEPLAGGAYASDEVLARTEHPVYLGGHHSGMLREGEHLDSFMGTHRRSADLPGPAYRIWVYDERVYISLRDGRLAILD